MLNRIIYSDNGTLSDVSVNLNKYHEGTASIPGFNATEDAIYIGARHPFNHLYWLISVVNSNSSAMTIQYWDGDEWIDTVEVIDETSGCSQSGFTTFFPNKDNSWARESTNFSGETVTGLTNVVIYDHYWIKVTFDVALSAGITFDWIGQIFADDNHLGDEFPDLNRVSARNAFLKDGQSPGDKTDWQPQFVKASEIIVKDLIAKGLIWDRGQILEKEQFRLAAVSKCAEIIYNGLGDDYLDDKASARQEYQSRLNKSILKLDKNANALLDVRENVIRTGVMTR